MSFIEDESKPPRPARPLPSGPTSRVQQAASNFANGNIPLGGMLMSPTTGKVSASKSVSTNSVQPIRTKEPSPTSPTMAPKGGMPLGSVSPKGTSHSFLGLKSSPSSGTLGPRKDAAMSYSGPPINRSPKSVSTEEVPLTEDYSYPQNPPASEDTHDLQLRDAVDRITRQNAEITVLRRELDNKVRIELELKTDLEVERQKVKDQEGVVVKKKEKPAPPPDKPPPPAVPPPPSNLLSMSSTNLAGTHQLNSQILELKATVGVLENENVMLRGEMDKVEKKGKDDQKLISDLNGEISGLRKEMAALRAQVETLSPPKQTTHKLYEVLYDFTPGNDGDLALHAGDVIELVEETNPSWWKGLNLQTNETGIFPSNYVQFKGSALGITEEIVIDETVPVRIVKAVFDYNAGDEDEVSFKKGDELELLHENDNGWWYGIHLLTNQAGLFPSNFAH